MRLLSAACEDDWTPPEGWAPAALPALDVLSSRLGSTFQESERRLRGPTPRSNWVVPGMVLAGDRTPMESEVGLKSLLGKGVTTFVNLQSRGEGQDYRERALKLKGDLKFVSAHIPDQKTTSDAQVARLVVELVGRIAAGEVLYVHCRGGHGRTGTVCSLLLGLTYGIRGPRALVTWQALHDLRQQPVFAARGYDLTPNGASCVTLFEEQRAQVLRLLPSADAADAADAWEAAAAAASATGAMTAAATAAATATAGGPLPPARGASEEYGRGASAYSADVLVRWRHAGEEGAAAATRGEWAAAARAFRECARLRPDWAKGYVCLGRALRRLGGSAAQRRKAAAFLEEGLRLSTAAAVAAAAAGGGHEEVAADIRREIEREIELLRQPATKSKSSTAAAASSWRTPLPGETM